MAFKQKIRVQPQAIQDTALMSLETKKKQNKTKTFSIFLENAKLHFKKKEIFSLSLRDITLMKVS